MSTVGATSSSNASSLSQEAVRKEPIFREINAEQTDEVVEIESACMGCFQTGVTRLLPTKIPFFREVVLMSFKCDHCGYTNNEMQSASEIQKSGVRIELEVKTVADLNRRVVRSDNSSVSIPEVELEIPVQSQKGEVTTVEGIIERTIAGLSQDQDKRRIDHPTEAATLDAYIERLHKLKEVTTPFRVLLEDISGNSFIENPLAPASDPQLKTAHFTRTKEQNEQLGRFPEFSDPQPKLYYLNDSRTLRTESRGATSSEAHRRGRVAYRESSRRSSAVPHELSQLPGAL